MLRTLNQPCLIDGDEVGEGAELLGLAKSPVEVASELRSCHKLARVARFLSEQTGHHQPKRDIILT